MRPVAGGSGSEVLAAGGGQVRGGESGDGPFGSVPAVRGLAASLPPYGYLCLKADYGELDAMNDLSLALEAPVAMNSVLFRVEGMEELVRSYAVSLFMAKRFHMKEGTVSYQDWEGRRKVEKGRVFSFEQDIRDYISASPQTILVKYPPLHFRPILAAGSVEGACAGVEVEAVRLY